jgi:hypothetical protein
MKRDKAENNPFFSLSLFHSQTSRTPTAAVMLSRISTKPNQTIAQRYNNQSTTS